MYLNKSQQATIKNAHVSLTKGHMNKTQFGIKMLQIQNMIDKQMQQVQTIAERLVLQAQRNEVTQVMNHIK